MNLVNALLEVGSWLIIDGHWLVQSASCVEIVIGSSNRKRVCVFFVCLISLKSADFLKIFQTISEACRFCLNITLKCYHCNDIRRFSRLSGSRGTKNNLFIKMLSMACTAIFRQKGCLALLYLKADKYNMMKFY